MNRVAELAMLTAMYLAVTPSAFCDKADDYYKSGRENLSNCNLGSGPCRHAVADFTKAIQLKPDFGEAYSGRGQAWSLMSTFEPSAKRPAQRNAAIADFTKAIGLKPGLSEAYRGRGQLIAGECLHSDDQHACDDAIADYTKAIQLDPAFLGGIQYKIRADLRRAEGDYDGAIADYTKAIQFGRDRPGGLAGSYYWLRGSLRQLRGDNDGAIADLTKAVQLAGSPPERQLYQKPLAEARYAAQRERNAKLAMLTKSVENFQDDPVSDVPGVVMVGPNALKLINLLLGPDVVFFTSREHPINRLADIMDPNTQLGVAELSPRMMALRQLIFGRLVPGASRPTGEPSFTGTGVEFTGTSAVLPLGVSYETAGGFTIMGIGSDGFGELFRQHPQLKLFVAPAGLGGVNAIESSGGGMRVRLVERPAR